MLLNISRTVSCLSYLSVFCFSVKQLCNPWAPITVQQKHPIAKKLAQSFKTFRSLCLNHTRISWFSIHYQPLVYVMIIAVFSDNEHKQKKTSTQSMSNWAANGKKKIGNLSALDWHLLTATNVSFDTRTAGENIKLLITGIFLFWLVSADFLSMQRQSHFSSYKLS